MTVEKPFSLDEIARHFASEISHCSDYGGGFKSAIEEVLPQASVEHLSIGGRDEATSPSHRQTATCVPRAAP